jgi:NagD protein
MVVTNNTKKESKEFYDYLKSIGFNFNFSSYIDPLMLLEDRVEKEAVAAYGSEEFLKTLQIMGYKLNYENPKAVLLATKEDFNADEYAQMIEFLLAGAKLIGMHETSIYAKNNKRYPGVGAVLKLLEFATSVSYEVVGKQSVSFYTEALKALHVETEFSNITMISDDVKGDLGGAKEMGMKTIFVTSGKYKSEAEIVPFLEAHLRPDHTYADMREILESL